VTQVWQPVHPNTRTIHLCFENITCEQVAMLPSACP